MSFSIECNGEWLDSGHIERKTKCVRTLEIEKETMSEREHEYVSCINDDKNTRESHCKCVCVRNPCVKDNKKQQIHRHHFIV